MLTATQAARPRAVTTPSSRRLRTAGSRSTADSRSTASSRCTRRSRNLRPFMCTSGLRARFVHTSLTHSSDKGRRRRTAAAVAARPASRVSSAVAALRVRHSGYSTWAFVILTWPRRTLRLLALRHPYLTLPASLYLHDLFDGPLCPFLAPDILFPQSRNGDRFVSYSARGDPTLSRLCVHH
jgi:hypothetical protein